MKDFVRVYGPLLALLVIGVLVALRFVDPPPPDRVTIAGGAAGGAYEATAKGYAHALADHGVTVDVLETVGSVDNLARLRAGQADAAIVQTGLAYETDTTGLASLGAVYYEPLWVFHRANLRIDSFAGLAGLTLALGEPGSGARALSTRLLSESGLAATDYTLASVGGRNAAAALRKGEVDAIFVVSGPDPVWIADLLADPNVALMNIPIADAFSRRHPHLDVVTLYRGVVDLARDLPGTDHRLLAPTAQVVVRSDLHPAIQSLLLDALSARHAGGSLLAPPGAFPDAGLVDVPLSTEARRYYENGPTFLRRVFPYSVANFLERAWVLAIPLITLLVPIIRAAPPLYRWRIRRKIYVWYHDLRELESRGRAAETDAERAVIIGQLADLQAETGKVEVPLSYTDDLYRLRSHIRFVSDVVQRKPVAAHSQVE